METESLFSLMHSRTTDPTTSRWAAASVASSAENDRTILLRVYRDAGSSGLTDEEAGVRAGMVGRGYWKRCSDLRRLGLIEPTGETRAASSGRMAMVCRARQEDFNGTD